MSPITRKMLTHSPYRSSMLHTCLRLGILLTWGFTQSRAQCTKDEYKRCVTLADPLLQDPHLIYPDNMRDIDHVCRTWGFFVDCVKRYTDRCFTETKRKEFSKAVESPVDSVHQMCTMPLYQEEYLKHASCMKSALVEESRCGRHYRHLVNQVAGEAARPTLCCSHHRFRECVLDQTRRSCQPDAAPYAKQILDKALSFLKEQCSNYIPPPRLPSSIDWRYGMPVVPIVIDPISYSHLNTAPTELDCPGADFYTSPSPNRPGDWKDVVRTTLPPWLESVGGRGPTSAHPWIPVSTGGVPMDPKRTPYTRAMGGSGVTTEVNNPTRGTSNSRPANDATPAFNGGNNVPDYNRPEFVNGGDRPGFVNGGDRPDFVNAGEKPGSGNKPPSSTSRPTDFDGLSSDVPWTPQNSNSIEEERPNQQGLANSGRRDGAALSLVALSAMLWMGLMHVFT